MLCSIPLARRLRCTAPPVSPSPPQGQRKPQQPERCKRRPQAATRWYAAAAVAFLVGVRRRFTRSSRPAGAARRRPTAPAGACRTTGSTGAPGRRAPFEGADVVAVPKGPYPPFEVMGDLWNRHAGVDGRRVLQEAQVVDGQLPRTGEHGVDDDIASAMAGRRRPACVVVGSGPPQERYRHAGQVPEVVFGSLMYTRFESTTVLLMLSR